MIRRARVIAVEGSHGTGKTTLVHALMARLTEEHMHAAVVEDGARSSPLVEDAVMHSEGEIDLATELHIMSSQLAREQELARHHELIVCDKSVLSVLAYTRLFLADRLTAGDVELFEAMVVLAQCYGRRYDGVFLLGDLYDLDTTPDPYRLRDPGVRERAAELICAECAAAAVKSHELPLGLATDEKVHWVLARLANRP
jgi:predicted ATPase